MLNLCLTGFLTIAVCQCYSSSSFCFIVPGTAVATATESIKQAQWLPRLIISDYDQQARAARISGSEQRGSDVAMEERTSWIQQHNYC